ncbi:ABC transporter ATP-binding protein [Nocardioides sp. cx-169]|uniref:ABC transporter ATP-binding protein n=1 Tax=Nocardioides sp. cx-169 TaxID=2899080 RepID=UPI001E448E47|nr:ABC transporter ATP-binding protein [Nocardioides sp. cx-169]MCD4533076.1 ABC transporter ATP-binding protein [Nocardioides sp. cx-169]
MSSSSPVRTEAAEAEPLLEVVDLTVQIPTAKGLLRAVGGVSLSLSPGETLGIVGESGSGKSMLARTIMGLIPPTAEVGGEVRYAGADLRSMSHRDLRNYWGKEISMVFQDPMTSLNPVVRIGRNLTETLRTHGVADRRTAKGRALELLAEVRIPAPATRFNAYPHELSGGMRQRVGIALAVACRPQLLIADEPTTALDVTVQKQVLTLLDKLQSEHHMAMVIITHDLGVVTGSADRVAVMYGGRIVETAPTATLFAEPRHPYTSGLIASMPSIDNKPHEPIPVIPGSPRPVIDPVGCTFASRCVRAQATCLTQTPELTGPDPAHQFACWFPMGTEEGDRVEAENRAAGVTAAGLRLDATSPSPASPTQDNERAVTGAVS